MNERPVPKVRRARGLRLCSTEAERRLWRYLRGRGLAGFKFRRQRPIGGYIVDFACLEARLVVEVDGGQHAVASAEDARDRALAARGFRVIRVWNHEIVDNIEGVLATIAAACDAGRRFALTLPLARVPPSPASGRGAG
jgi:very-short-patch-repair endonuclease